MLSKKIVAVIKREFLTRVKTKGFIIGTLLLPFLMLLIMGGVVVFAIFMTDEQKTIYVIDQTGRIFEEFAQQFSDTLNNGERVYQFIEKKVTPDLSINPSGVQSDIDAALEQFRRQILNEEIDGYIYIPEDVIESREVKYAARNVTNFEEQTRFTSALSRIVTNIRLENLGLSAEEIRREMARGRIRLNTPQVTERGEVESSGGVNVAIAYVLTYLLFLTLMIYGQMVMRSVIEEKTQRITETIVSSVKPFELMAGKITGICALGITQLAVWGFIILIPILYGESIINRFAPEAADIIRLIHLIHFSGTTFIFFIIFFILGFVLYASLYAAIGAMVNTEDEAQQLQFPIILPIIIQYMLFFIIVQRPESNMAYWTSIIPFFTSILMTARLSVMEPQLPDGLFLSLFLMIITVVLTVMLVSKIYRVGILMYGKRPSIKELVKWIRYS